MWSKNKLKYVRSLRLKKFRDADGAFLAEGHKVVGDLLGRFPCRLLAATADYVERHGDALALPPGVDIDVVTPAELEQASCLTTPHGVLAVFGKPDAVPFRPSADRLTLVLDGVQDPGNVGTIIRLADWFGIDHLLCSPDTADAFAPKVVQATMGALARVAVTYGDLPALLAQWAPTVPVYGTFMEGDNLYDTPLTAGGLLVMGNEGNGISDAVAATLTRRLHIPSFPPERPTVESLNVAMATAITVAEFRRRVGR
jgi:TrmH family RNA methyltransferase